jgi:site-specific recombinase XerC
MIQLPNGCRCSELKVNPKNWESTKASVKKNWFIYYRFYDPKLKDKFPKGKLRVIKRMNGTTNLKERQTLVRELILLELQELKTLGYNPISEVHETPLEALSILAPETGLSLALRSCFEKSGYKGQTQNDLRSVLKWVEKAAALLQIQYLPVKDFRPSHLLVILEQLGKIKRIWTANNYNYYLKYLSILFGQLVQYRAIEFNPARDIRKKKVVRQLRKILNTDERKRIDQVLKEYDINFWRFIHIFFHSGSRTTELLRVKGEDVDLKNQRVKYLVLKGQQHQWVERTIKDSALPFWKEAVKDCSKSDYVFSKNLQPGEKQIRPEQIVRRWKLHVKLKLGIDCDFYSLKHLNTDETSALLGLEIASAHNSHKSSAITLRYAVNESERVHDRIKKIGNTFS